MSKSDSADVIEYPLAERMSKLEHRLRRREQQLGVALIAIAGLATLGFHRLNEAPEELRARRFVLVDGDQVLGQLACRTSQGPDGTVLPSASLTLGDDRPPGLGTFPPVAIVWMRQPGVGIGAHPIGDYSPPRPDSDGVGDKEGRVRELVTLSLGRSAGFDRPGQFQVIADQALSGDLKNVLARECSIAGPARESSLEIDSQLYVAWADNPLTGSLETTFAMRDSARPVGANQFHLKCKSDGVALDAWQGSPIDPGSSSIGLSAIAGQPRVSLTKAMVARVVIGQAELLSKTTGITTRTNPSTITLFDESGSAVYQVP